MPLTDFQTIVIGLLSLLVIFSGLGLWLLWGIWRIKRASIRPGDELGSPDVYPLSRHLEGEWRR